MSTATASLDAAEKPADVALPWWLSINHAATIFTSAFLLFEVQPLISKFILPWFGGSPAVWTTCMLFFQLTLFAGYAYAHLVTNRLSPKAQAILHLTLLVVAITRLPIVPDESWKPTDGADPTWRIMALLGMTVGLPYFMLSTTGPLVQAWFSRAYAGRSPYRLYSLSNVGSLLALLSYPFVIEPAWDVLRQAWIWSAMFGVFAVLCATGAIWNWRLGHVSWRHLSGGASAESAGSDRAIVQQDAAPSTWRRILWIALPASASLMLLATTNHVCQDVAVVPFLWVIPLSLYLLTFIICFDQERWYQPVLFGIGALVLVMLTAGYSPLRNVLLEQTGHRINFMEEIALYFTMMFFVCMTCHGELVRLRPSPKYLTEFYLMISAGGALGGVFVSLIAPHIFKTFFEWKIALFLAMVIATAVTFVHFKAIAHTTLRSALGFVVAVIGVGLIAYWQLRSDVVEDRARNFYGTVTVFEDETDAGDKYRVMYHGGTAHGRQYMSADKSRTPIAYYSTKSGVGRAFHFLNETKEPRRIGTIGLGVGTTASYARPGDVYRFYEINPEVKRQAENFFTFLKDCQGKHEIVMGDARLALEREEPQKYDLLVCDAFSGDSIPAHLATQEAFAIYKKHLKPDGILAVNITNRYIDIFPVIRGMADHFGWKWTRIYTLSDSDHLLYRADWMLLSNNQAFLDKNPMDVPKEFQTDRDVALWTDHFSNLFDVLK